MNRQNTDDVSYPIASNPGCFLSAANTTDFCLFFPASICFSYLADGHMQFGHINVTMGTMMLTIIRMIPIDVFVALAAASHIHYMYIYIYIYLFI